MEASYTNEESFYSRHYFTKKENNAPYFLCLRSKATDPIINVILIFRSWNNSVGSKSSKFLSYLLQFVTQLSEYSFLILIFRVAGITAYAPAPNPPNSFCNLSLNLPEILSASICESPNALS